MNRAVHGYASYFFLTLLIAVCVAMPGFAQEQPAKLPKPTWEVVFLKIERRLHFADLDQPGDGTRVKARFEIPGRLIVGVDLKSSSLESWKDDKGTDLLAAPLRMKEWKNVERDTNQHAVGSGAVTLNAGGIPALGASKLHLKGTIAALVAKDEKTFEKKDLVFPAVIDLGFGTLKMSFGLDSKLSKSKPFVGSRPIKSADLDVDGKTLTLNVRTIRSSIDEKGMAEFHTAISLGSFEKTEIKRGTIRITFYDSVEKLMVPLNLEIGIGL
jgi:hypothetical protein